MVPYDQGMPLFHETYSLFNDEVEHRYRLCVHDVYIYKAGNTCIKFFLVPSLNRKPRNRYGKSVPVPLFPVFSLETEGALKSYRSKAKHCQRTSAIHIIHL